jgi:hypothetical protein
MNAFFQGIQPFMDPVTKEKASQGVKPYSLQNINHNALTDSVQPQHAGDRPERTA